MDDKWIITFDRNENVLMKLFRILGFVIALVCIFFAIIGQVEHPFWMLALTYFGGMFFLGNKNVVQNTPGMVTLNVVLFCKYSLLPLVLYITGELSTFSKGYKYINHAVVLMLIELICIWVAIGFTGRKKKTLYKNFYYPDVKLMFKNQYVNVMFLCIVLITIVLLVRYPYLVGGIKLLLSGAVEYTESFSDISSIASLFWKAAITWIYLYVMSVLKTKQSKGSNVKVRLLIVSVIYLFFTFVGQTTIARWYTVISYMAVVYFVKSMFPKSLKFFLYGSIVPILLLIFVASIYKNTDFLNSSENIIVSFSRLFDVTVLDAYFSGPVCVNNAIYVYEIGEGNIFSLFFDLIRNMPIVNHVIDISHSTVKIYAEYMGRKDQIIPLVGQSLIYFGPIFSPTLSIASIYIIRKFDDMYLKSTSAMLFVYSYCAVWTAVIYMLNLTVYVSGFYSTIIPLVIMLWMTIPKIK